MSCKIECITNNYPTLINMKLMFTFENAYFRTSAECENIRAFDHVQPIHIRIPEVYLEPRIRPIIQLF